MYPERKSSWSKLTCDFHGSSRQEKVLEYMIHRGNDGACLDEVLVETYVRQNCSDGEVDELLSTSRFFYAVQARLWSRQADAGADLRHRVLTESLSLYRRSIR